MIAALAGLPARDAAALKIFLGMAFKGCHVVQAPATPGLALPRADVCIVDLAAMGLSHWSPKAEADLLLCLGGQHALLLGAVGNASWQDKVHATGRHGAQRLAYLAKPYGRDAMREALDSLGLGSGPAPDASPAPVSVSALSEVAPLLPSAFASLQAVRTLFPDLQRHALLDKLLDLLATGQPHELRITLHQALIVHPRQGWVAHNTSPDVLARLAQHGQTAIGMNARALDSEDDIQRRLAHMTARENLDTFFWRLAQESMGQGTPTPTLTPFLTRDAELRLVCMPGFTRIAGANDLALQLAAICLRLPQTLSSLRAAFPEVEAKAIERFVLLATVCGAGRLRLLDAPPRARHKVRTERRPAPRAPQPHRSFFRAMLQKLF